MKKFIAIVSVIVALVIIIDTAHYRLGWYIDFQPNKEIEVFTKVDDDKIMIKEKNEYVPFEIKGVNMGSGMPGEWSTDFAIDKATYLRWFKYIQEMGANTIRIYTIQDDTFYNAFYEYNKNNEKPLYLIHGVWVNDYVQYSRKDAFDKDFRDKLIADCRTLIDVIHGNKKISLGRMASAGSGTYNKDISPWVVGYILGVEWEDVTVKYTNEKYKDNNKYNTYKGEYMYANEDAEPFECMLASVGDKVIAYESNKYKKQCPVAFSNWTTTDPFEYPDNIKQYFMKCGKVDVEHIECTDKFKAGQFVSYHVYPYYPDYLYYVKDMSEMGVTDTSEFMTEDGKLNTYRMYLSMLKKHHTMPLVISEFGVSTGRGMAQRELSLGRNQGHMSEKDQGQAILDCYEDIKSVGVAGCCVFSWQDEWFKRTWNTMYAVNMKRNPYWSDYQTNEQYFGLLSFDPGKEKCISYVDGDVSEWTKDDIVSTNNGVNLSIKYDERFVYFLVDKKDLDLSKDKIYIPIDTTPKTGSKKCDNYKLNFDRDVDFVIAIDGKDNTRIVVQERYESLRSTYGKFMYGFNTYLKGNIPEKDSSKFVNIQLILLHSRELLTGDENSLGEGYETGLLKYGNANPESEDFDSLADFISNGDYIELKLPWQILNFADPSRMTIHDDYYDDNYGVEYIDIDKMYVGASSSTNDEIKMSPFALKGWGNDVTYHERLKSSYYMLQNAWKE